MNMEHYKLFWKIMEYLPKTFIRNYVDIFSLDFKSKFNMSLFSLWTILDNSKIFKNTLNTKSREKPQAIPSLNKNIKISKEIIDLFFEGTTEKTLSYMMADYTKFAANNENNSSDILMENFDVNLFDLKNQFNCFRVYNDNVVFITLFYFYLHIIFEETEIFSDDFRLWDDNLIQKMIYLPLEGMVNLDYLRFSFIADKREFISTIHFDKQRDDDTGRKLSKIEVQKTNDKITQYDFGYELNDKIRLTKTELIEILYCLRHSEPYSVHFEPMNHKNLIEKPLEWLKLFHIYNKKNEISPHLLRLIKALHNVDLYLANKNNSASEKNDCCQILAKANESNFSVRGISYPNLYGEIITCIKSMVFRDINIGIISELEYIHDTIMNDLGVFVNEIYKYLTDGQISNVFKEQTIEIFKFKIGKYKFSALSCERWQNDVLIQIVSWIFLSEIYSYLKTQISMIKYITDNWEAINDSSGYKYSYDYAKITISIDKIDLAEIKSIYAKHTFFENVDLDSLIGKTQKIILNFFADTYREQKAINTTLGQFIAVSMVVVKAERGAFKQIPENKFFRSSTQRLTVSRLLEMPSKELKLREIDLGSNLLSYQNMVFKECSRLDLYNEAVVNGYEKITNYIEEQFPIMKSGKIITAKKDDDLLLEKISPYDALSSVYDITVELFDDFLK